MTCQVDFFYVKIHITAIFVSNVQCSVLLIFSCNNFPNYSLYHMCDDGCIWYFTNNGVDCYEKQICYTPYTHSRFERLKIHQGTFFHTWYIHCNTEGLRKLSCFLSSSSFSSSSSSSSSCYPFFHSLLKDMKFLFSIMKVQASQFFNSHLSRSS